MTSSGIELVTFRLVEQCLDFLEKLQEINLTYLKHIQKKYDHQNSYPFHISFPFLFQGGALPVI
jgi:hypothetical protein